MKTHILARDARSAGFSGAEPQGIPMEVMEISPAAQAEMLLVSAVVGAVAGVVFDLLRVFRTAAVDGYERPAYYERALPLVGVLNEGVLRRRAAGVLLALADIIFPVAWAAAMLCVFFVADDGIFRLSGLIAGALGFMLWRKTLGRPFRACGNIIVYAIRAAVAYICFPAVFAMRLIFRGVKAAATALSRLLRERKIRKFDARERERLMRLAAEGFGAGGVFESGDRTK